MKAALIIILGFVAFSSQAQLRIVADGNSYVEGNGYTPFPVYVGTTFSTSVQNLGVSGQTVTNMLSDIYSEVLPTYVTGQTNFLLVVEGGNEIYFNAAATAAH